MAKDDLKSIDVQSGVNEEGKGFVTVVATTEDDRMFLAQMTPALLREVAMNYLCAAEAAETDAIVYRLLLNKFELPLGVIGAFITDMRNSREE